MSAWMHHKVEVRETEGKGRGLFAKRDISKHTLLAMTTGRLMSAEQILNDRDLRALWYHAFQVEMLVQLVPDGKIDGIFSTNHSCAPNAGIRNASSLVSMRDIAIDEEICFDYVMVDCRIEFEPSVSMNCLCGHPECRKVITDVDWKIPELQAKYKGYFSTYLQDIIENNGVAFL